MKFLKMAALVTGGMAALGSAVIVGVFNDLVILGQSSPAFEAASVKAVPESVDWPPRRGYWVMPRMDNPQRFRARTQALSLIEWAFRVRDFQILQAPAWTKEAKLRFEVQATTAQPSTPDEVRQMVQLLLADRFKLRFHRETRELSVFALVVGKNGPKLPTAKNSLVNEGEGDISIGNGAFLAKGIAMTTFVGILTENLDRPVVDMTNLTGHYDFILNYDQSSLPDWRLGPALFSLVQDLGLKLESRKAAIEMIVIDSIDRPSEN